MKNLNIAIIDPEGKYSKDLAKKGSETDFRMYNYKEGDTVLVLYEPHAYPDKIQSLLHCLNLCDSIVWVVSKADAEFAEVALAVLQGGKNGILVFSGITEEEISPILSKTPVWQWERLAEPPSADLRAKVMSQPEPERGERKLAVIDSCFTVGGVGTVALAKIEGGTFKVHDELELTPSMQKAGIRSIQVQDVDVKEAPPGSRAGFALKNASAENVKRGAYFAEAGTCKKFTSGEAEIELSPLVKDTIAPGSDVFLSWGMQYFAAKLKTDKPIGAKDGKMKLQFTISNDAAAFAGQGFLLVRPDKKPRVIGKGKFIQI